MEGQTQTTSESKKTDAELLSGGPAGDHGKPMPKHGDSHPETSGVETKPQQSNKYEINGKSFQSAQEMSQYVADLERKVINPQPTVQQQVKTPVQSKVELIDGQPIDEVLFTNPTKVLHHFEQKVESRINAQKAQEEQKRQFWTSFYSDNPDLKGKEDLVDAFVARNWETWKELPVPEFGKAVANESRSKLKKLGLSNATVMENRSAATLSSSGDGVETAIIEKRATTFVDELNIKRRARKAK